MSGMTPTAHQDSHRTPRFPPQSSCRYSWCFRHVDGPSRGLRRFEPLKNVAAVHSWLKQSWDMLMWHGVQRIGMSAVFFVVVIIFVVFIVFIISTILIIVVITLLSFL